MDATESARRDMIDKQLRPRGIRDPRVLAAMARVPRHLFVPEAQRAHAYNDSALPLALGQTISQPLMVAEMLQCMELRGDERVLEVGAGSGYQAALLSLLAREVIAIEVLPELADLARANLARAGIDGVRVVAGDGSLGYAEFAPYDAIVVAAAAPSIPAPLLEQLAEGGRLLIPVGDRDGQTLLRVRRNGETYEREPITLCSFVPLVGSRGFSSNNPW